MNPNTSTRTPSEPVICVSCMDYRYNDLLSKYMTMFQYYNISTAGGGLTLAMGNLSPSLAQSVLDNIDIAHSLSASTKLYIINHQDCGAFRAFLPESGYPSYLGEDNRTELNIHSYVLQGLRNMPDLHGMNVKVGVIDYNGTVADIEDGRWVIKFVGPGQDPRGLFFTNFV